MLETKSAIGGHTLRPPRRHASYTAWDNKVLYMGVVIIIIQLLSWTKYTETEAFTAHCSFNRILIIFYYCFT